MKRAFSFAEWYARMGYHRHGGIKACADAIGRDRRYVRYMLDGERQPGDALIERLERLEREAMERKAS